MDWFNIHQTLKKKGVDMGNKDVSDLQKQKDFITRKLGITRKVRMFFRQKENGITWESRSTQRDEDRWKQ